jgi:RES domain-containing protein
MYNLPDKLKIKEIKLADIIKNNPDWTRVINYPYIQAIGDHWLATREAAVLKVPSAIIDLEYNYLLNPAYPDFNQIKIAVVKSFTFDTRLKTS